MKEKHEKNSIKRLYRSKDDKVIAGVCAGVGKYLEIDPVIVRIIWAVFAICGVGILAYLLAWVIIPKEP